MAFRNLPTAIQDALVQNTSLNTFHLIKFEKPSSEASQSTSPTDYSYLTDCFHDIEYDGQVYRAGTVVSVGDVQETIEAKATSLNVSLSAAKLGAAAVTSITNSSAGVGVTFTLESSADLFGSGFIAGDIVTVTGDYSLRIEKLYANKTTVQVTNVGTSTFPAHTNTPLTFTYNSPEITALIASKTALNYSNYINRNVIVYRAYFNPETGAMIDSPVTLFNGNISKCSVQEKTSGDPTVTWALVSHWGDFVRVQGRLTSDEFHRALNAVSVSDTDALLDADYAEDYGFEHAEKALNVVATYNDTVTETRYKRSAGWITGGLLGKMKEYQVTSEVQRELDLRLNLEARFIPVVYGVQKIKGIPVFADVTIRKDTDAGDAIATGSTTLYTANALCEGPIGGIYDLYIEGTGVICRDDQDADARSASNSPNLVCIGKMAEGDVLGGEAAYSGLGNENNETFLSLLAEEDLSKDPEQNRDIVTRILTKLNISSNKISNTGILHEQTFNYKTEDSDINITFHAGTHMQNADQTLLEIASGITTDSTGEYINGFLVQSQYSTDPSSYWTANHRLLDTAYVVSEDLITAEDGKAPEYEYVVKGKYIDCFNYDGSYRSPSNQTIADNFNLGDSVTLTLPDSSTISAKIIDKFILKGPTGAVDTRFILKTANDTVNTKLLNGEYGRFSMTKGADTWIFQSDSYTGDNSSPVTPVITDYTLAGQVDIQGVDIPFTRAVTATTRTISTADEDRFGTQTGGGAQTVYSYEYTMDLSGLSAEVKNSIKALKYIDSSVSPLIYIKANHTLYPRTINLPVDTIDTTTFTATFYGTQSNMDALFLGPGASLSVVGTTSTTSITISCDVLNRYASYKDPTDTSVQSAIGGIVVSKRIDGVDKGYVTVYSITSTQDAALATALDTAGLFITDGTLYVPGSTVTYSYGGQNLAQNFTYFGDFRVSTNPVWQVFDYLTNKRYGKGLGLEFLDLDSFKETARLCDEQSDVNVLMDAGEPVQLGATYRYPAIATGPAVFEGTVSKITTNAINGLTQVTFTDVIGKLGRKWEAWKVYKLNELIWNYQTGEYAVVSSPGTISAWPASGGGTLALYKNGVANVSTDIVIDTTTLSPENNPFVKQVASISGADTIVSGYSLYDSDDVVYWKYLGWEEQSQRYVTRHQTNMTIDTSTPVFDNLNGMLLQFNGMLSYTNGKYSIGLRTKAPEWPAGTDSEIVEIITQDDIIGDIKLEDKGISKTYNSITAQILDPVLGFEPRSLSFFNSTYLKQDKGIQRQGNYASPGVSNYYNARINIKQFLDESRYGTTISFTMVPKGYLLKAGGIIGVSYPRFNWERKYFRINTINVQRDNMVRIVADEHNDDAYLLDSPISSVITKKSRNTGAKPVKVLARPQITSISAAAGSIFSVDLNWTNDETFNPATHTIEIWRSDTTDFGGAVLIGTSKSNTYRDVLAESQSQTNYYWIRYSILTSYTSAGIPNYSYSKHFYPRQDLDGIEGVTNSGGADGQSAIIVNIVASNGTVFKNNSGTTTLSVIVYDAEDGSVLTPTSYKWTYADGTDVRVDGTNNVVASGGSIATGAFSSIIVGAEDVPDDGTKSFNCEVTV